MLIACENKEALEAKQLHGQLHRETKDAKSGESSWEWLRSGNLKRETESLLLAAEDQAQNTNSVKKDIYHITGSLFKRNPLAWCTGQLTRKLPITLQLRSKGCHIIALDSFVILRQTSSCPD